MKFRSASKSAELAKSASCFRHLMCGASRGLVYLLAGSSLFSAVSAQDTSTAPAPEASAQAPTGSGEIRGRVFNAETGRAVSRAIVTIDGTSRQTLTNDFGEYSFYNVPSGPVRVRVSFTGRDPLYRTVEVPVDGSAQSDFTFSAPTASGEDDETVYELDAFVVRASDYQTASQIAIQQERTALTQRNVVDTDAFGIVPDGNVGEFIKFMPGVQVNYGQGYSSGADASSVSVRGLSSSQIPITVDGLPISSSVPGSLTREVALDTLSINNAARVEVIKVPTPDQPNASIGGTVNLVSKSAFEYPKPTLRFRIWLTVNSENFDDFWKKTPGPADEKTYKALPGAELSYAYPVTDTFGFTVNLAQSNSFNPGTSAKTDYKFDGNRELGPYVNADGTVIGDLREDKGGTGGVFGDAAHPYLNTISVTDTPRSSTRTSGSLKLDWRPIEGHLLTFNIQHSIYESREAARRFQMSAETDRGVISFGPDHMVSDVYSGSSGIDVESLDREGDATSGYVRWKYTKGPWDAEATASYSLSNGSLDSSGNGHFSNAELSMGNVYLARFADIDDGLPGTVEYYGLTEGVPAPYPSNSAARKELANPARLSELVDQGVLYRLDPTKLSSYELESGYNPNNPAAGSLVVKTGQSESRTTIKTYKADLRRELDFIPLDFVNLAAKVGVYREEREDEKWGEGVGRRFAYVGSGLSPEDFRDTEYVGIDPGFGFEPREWLDVYKLYDYYQDNPTAFDDTDDRPVWDGQQYTPSLAAQNWDTYVTQQKSIKETKDDYYFQLESNWFDNRLTIVGGFRQSSYEREGRVPYRNGSWKELRIRQDEDGDGWWDPIPAVYKPDLSPVSFADYTSAGRDAAFFYNPTIYNSPVLYTDPNGTGEQISMREYLDRFDVVYNTPTDMEAEPFDPANPLDVNRQRIARAKYVPGREVGGKVKTDPSPIISSSYDLTDKITLRAAWSKVNGMPEIEGAKGLVREFRIDDKPLGESGNIVIPNRNLEPEISENWDFSISYYTDNGGKITLSYFMKEVTNNSTDLVYYLGYTENEAAARALAESFGVPFESRYYSDNWAIKTPVNIDTPQKTRGYEIEVQQSLGILGDWGKNIQIYASMSDQDTDEIEQVVVLSNNPNVDPDPVTPSTSFSSEQSNLAINGGLNWAIWRFTTRVNVAWRDEKITRTAEAYLFPDPLVDDKTEENRTPIYFYEPARTTVDLTVSYRFWKEYYLSVSGRNITNAEHESYVRGPDLPDYAHTIERSKYGVMWTVGISGTF
ncbi:MAG: TonB-dependent receptor [Verrucomicrobiota bacterium JB022]|nr:TonB-dependent receptor [Verrucomicrobiota bacterium JB022]